jgi:hypothetical protein
MVECEYGIRNTEHGAVKTSVTLVAQYMSKTVVVSGYVFGAWFLFFRSDIRAKKYAVTRIPCSVFRVPCSVFRAPHCYFKIGSPSVVFAHFDKDKPRQPETRQRIWLSLR